MLTCILKGSKHKVDFTPVHRRKQPEKKISDALREYMHTRGWWTEKMPGSKFKSGIPDIYACHLEFGQKWIETKVPLGKLRPTQIYRFTKWSEHGVGIWVIMNPNDYPKLFKEPNWFKYV